MVHKLPWPLVSFGDLFSEPLRNGIYKQKEFHGRGCKIVNMGELFAHPRLRSNIEMSRVELTEKEKEKSLLESGDLIFARRSLTAEGAGKCTLILDVDEETTFESSIIRVRLDKNKALPDFYYYLFNSPIGKWLLGTILRQTAVSGITGGDLSKLLVPQPPLNIQQQLVESGRLLDDKITLSHQINQTLEQMAQALFKSWFVDFDPVVDNALDAGFFDQDLTFSDELLRRAEARRAVREHDDFKPLPEATRQLFPAAFEECAEPSLGLGGWVPQGWKPRPVSALIDLIGGGTPKTSEESYWGGDIPWFSVVDAPNDSDVFVIDTEKKVTELGVEKSSTKILRKGTTIISARGTVGKCAVVATPMAMNQSCYGIVSNNGVNDYFIYYLIRQSVSQLQQRSHGSVFSTITRDTFNSFSFSFSGEQIANEFGKTISPWLDKILSNNRQESVLVSLRDTLLPKLISGDLCLDNIAADLAKEGVA